MARKKKHEEHLNAEAWAIPYGDLITLLLAFFVVMYAVSSVNEGKYRVLADSLSRAFNGAPRSLDPIKVGQRSSNAPEKAAKPSIIRTGVMDSGAQTTPRTRNAALPDAPRISALEAMPNQSSAPSQTQLEQARLDSIAEQVRQALSEMIDMDLIMVRRHAFWLEVEIQTDILFGSGSARIAGPAQEILAHLAQLLQPFDNPLRIEGHTDNQPISTAAFPSNWELSAARAASVVHLFANQGVPAHRMSVAGYGEFRPRQSNDSKVGRDRNRRVLVVILANHQEAEALHSLTGAIASEPDA